MPKIQRVTTVSALKSRTNDRLQELVDVSPRFSDLFPLQDFKRLEKRLEKRRAALSGIVSGIGKSYKNIVDYFTRTALLKIVSRTRKSSNQEKSENRICYEVAIFGEV